MLDAQPHSLYRATGPTGRSYIGYTKDLNSRVIAHRHAAKTGGTSYFHCALRKHGADNFKWEVLAIVQGEGEAKRLEVELIAKFQTKAPGGYNLTDGGEGMNPTAETRARMSAAKKGQYTGADNPFYGREHSAEVRARMSAAAKGKPKSAAHRRNIGAARKGCKHTAAARAAISAAHKGRYSDHRNRAETSAACKGGWRRKENGRRARVVAAVIAGKKCIEAADMAGCCVATVYKVRNKYALPVLWQPLFRRG